MPNLNASLLTCPRRKRRNANPPSATLDALDHLLDQATVKLPGNIPISDFNATGTGHYDGAGVLLSLTSTLTGAPVGYAGTTSYVPDGLGQLLHEQTTRGTRATNAFGNDAVGNVTTFRDSTQGYNRDNRNSVFFFDAYGNPGSWQTQALSFDPTTS